MKKNKLTTLYAVVDDTVSSGVFNNPTKGIEFVFKTEEEAEKYAAWANKNCSDGSKWDMYFVHAIPLLENWEVEE
mgnify:FL=1